ncbi:YeaC family protein [Exilibacterium tricleocarpae]|nr:DUF1315 family protein [Exilibacterium tricleocarpae]
MDFNELLDTLTPEVYANLKRAVELGKWPDGRPLTREQRQLSLQAVIAYEVKHLPEHERSGYIPPKTHSHCGGSGELAGPDAEQPLNWH